jgi:hypothetical protein
MQQEEHLSKLRASIEVPKFTWPKKVSETAEIEKLLKARTMMIEELNALQKT